MSEPILVFSLPLELALTQNQLQRKHFGTATRIGTKIAWHIIAAGGRPKARATQKRAVRITRFSSKQPDEARADGFGAKAALDALVRLGWLVDDSPTWCDREARWEKCAPKAGRVVVEVFET